MNSEVKFPWRATDLFKCNYITDSWGSSIETLGHADIHKRYFLDIVKLSKQQQKFDKVELV
jgi:hypothetical protein